MNPTTSSDALTQLQQFQGSAQKPEDILSGSRAALGVNSAQDTVTGLRGAIQNTTKLLNQVAPSVMGRTGNSLVTAAQANRIIQNEQQPISANLTQETGDLGNATQDLGRLSDQALQEANLKIGGQNDKTSYLQNIYNTLYKKEQDAETAKQAELDRQEQTRQFNADLASKNSANSSNTSGLAAILAGMNNNKAPVAVNPLSLPGATSKNGGVLAPGSQGITGYNFVNPDTKAPISAATFSNLNGVDIADTLKAMAQSGDKTAGQAYQDLVNAGGKYDDKFKSKYSSLFWGS